MERRAPTPIEEWRKNWPLVLACAIGASLSVNAIAHLGVFIQPLEQEFGWERAKISSGLTIYALGGVFFAPVVGAMVDRWGPRPVGLTAVILDGLAFALFSTATGSYVHWLGLWSVFALASQGTRMLVWYTAVSSRFEASRGLAIAACSGGASIGSTISPIVADHLITEFGWRSAYLIMGLVWGGTAALFCYLFFDVRNTSKKSNRSDKPIATAPLPGLPAKQAILSTRFLRIALTVAVFEVVFVALNIHMVPLLTSKGLSSQEAAWLVGIGHLAGAAGLFLSGYMVARVPGHLFGGAISLLPIISCVMLLIPAQSVSERFIPVIILLIAISAEGTLFAYLTSRYFGLRAYGFVYGLIGSFMATAIGVGPVLAGFVFDQTKSYDLVLMAGIPAAIISSVLIFSLGRYPDWTVDQKGVS